MAIVPACQRRGDKNMNEVAVLIEKATDSLDTAELYIKKEGGIP